MRESGGEIQIFTNFLHGDMNNSDKVLNQIHMRRLFRYLKTNTYSDSRVATRMLSGLT
jgi:hypothetical protein